MPDMPSDPFTYIGRVKRSEDGRRVVSMEVFGPEDVITLEHMDEFITFTTVTDLMMPREVPGETSQE